MNSIDYIKKFYLNCQIHFLIIGKNGWIGCLLQKLFTDLGIKFSLSNSRLENKTELKQEIENIKPTNIICCAGITGRPNVDWCEDHQIETIRTNVTGTLNLADICEELKIHCTLFATGCIYEYDKEHPIGGKGFTEEDIPNFTNSFYSKTKGMVDQILKSYSYMLVLRVRMPISNNLAPRCFITKISQYKRVVNIPNSMTVLHTMLPISVLLSLKNTTGIFNFTNPGVISHNECLELYKTYIDNNFTYTNFTLEEQDKILKAGRSNNFLDTTKLEKELPENIQIPFVKDAVKDALMIAKKSMNSPTNILLTGGAGFIGSHVADEILLEYKDCNLTILDSLEYCSSVNNIPDEANFIKCNIKNIDKLMKIFNEGNFDTIFHFAAETHVDNSFGNSTEFTNTNVLGTHNLLECVKKHKDTIKRFIHVSTDEVYGENNHVNDIFREDSSLLVPTNPYSATKASAEMLVKAYYHSFKLPVIITRGNNVYGPRQYPEKLIPILINCIKENKPFTMHGEGTAKRSYLYVNDVAKAFIKILKYGEIGQTYNIGTNQERTVKSVVEDISKLSNVEIQIEKVEDRPFNDSRYFIETKKLENLGWSPKYEWEDGLNETYRWYKEISKNYW